MYKLNKKNIIVIMFIIFFCMISKVFSLEYEVIKIIPRLDKLVAIVGHPAELISSALVKKDEKFFWTSFSKYTTFEVSLGSMESETSSVLILPDSGSEDIVVTAHYNDLVSTGTLEVHWSPIKELIVPDSIEVKIYERFILKVLGKLYDGTIVRINQFTKFESENTDIISITNNNHIFIKSTGEVMLYLSTKGKKNIEDNFFSDITGEIKVKVVD